ncbi:chitinase [Metarhizium robertsii ARSEF 23]|uniref:Chitinase n=1 Tax=Metarhizium robertsii (strain ARSEF 23 / ATCC MYA-3075) TaxID=655844 RepID=E9EJM6_METRA|nr:chitinase [Metarhizium robertsii ARSEF 23]EFZ03350.2 chitinase [Metarhizium robertsii ARSEF 23]
MDTFHLSSPPTPGGGSVSAADNNEMEAKALDAPPAGWISPISFDPAVVKPDPKIGAYFMTEYGTAELYERNLAFAQYND